MFPHRELNPRTQLPVPVLTGPGVELSRLVDRDQRATTKPNRRMSQTIVISRSSTVIALETKWYRRIASMRR